MSLDIAGFVIHLMDAHREHDYMDIDGGDIYQWAIQYGLCEERPMTEEESKEDWAREWDMRPGDKGTFFTPEFQALRALVKGKTT